MKDAPGRRDELDVRASALDAAAQALADVADRLDAAGDPVARAKLLPLANEAIDGYVAARDAFDAELARARAAWDTRWRRVSERLPALESAVLSRLGPLTRMLVALSADEIDEEELDLAEREAAGDPELVALVRELREDGS